MTKLAVCIGAPRSGTTWLFSQLRKSASVFAPPVKEVRYLTGRRSAEQRTKNIEFTRANVPLGADDEAFLDSYSKVDYSNLGEYAQLMMDSTDKPWTIDISPIYSTMNKSDIEKLGDYFNRDVKIIMLVRDCVDRAYSQANLHFHMHGKYDKAANHSEYISLLSTKDQILRSNYPKTIDNWVETFGTSNFHLCFYEDLARNPASCLNAIFDFLGVSDLEDMSQFEEKVVGSSKDKQFVQAPKTLKPLLAAQLLPFIDEMSKRYPDKCVKWRESALSYLDKIA